MGEFVIIIWAACVLVGGMLFVWSIKVKKRKPGRYLAIHKFILLLLTFGLGCLLFYLLGTSSHLIWLSRFTFILLGVSHVWAMYGQAWSVRDKLDYAEDSFLPEFIFTVLQSFIASISFCLAPQIVGLVEYKVDVSMSYWDLPLAFIFPFFLSKCSDLASQIPFRVVENTWVYPLEPVSGESWPWRELMQVNFHVKKSLLEEYRLLTWPAKPWIEAPKEISLGNAFRLTMQIRRQKSQLTTIQDLGDEYMGDPKFWWLFSIKVIWWNPTTWFRKPRYLNPDLSIRANSIRKQDVVVARRIPMDAVSFQENYRGHSDYDADKTVIIHK